MRILIIALIVFLNFILQSTVLGYAQIFGIMPNTALIIVITYAMLRDDVEGAMVGFAAGLLNDVFFGRIIGVSALLMMLTGFLCGKPFRDFFKENYIAPILLVGAASIAYEFMFYVLNFLLLGRVNFPRYFVQIILPTALYNMIVGIIIYRVLYGVNRRLEAREERKKGFMRKR